MRTKIFIESIEAYAEDFKEEDIPELSVGDEIRLVVKEIIEEGDNKIIRIGIEKR
jgi:ribosomal protein L19